MYSANALQVMLVDYCWKNALQVMLVDYCWENALQVMLVDFCWENALQMMLVDYCWETALQVTLVDFTWLHCWQVGESANVCMVINTCIAWCGTSLPTSASPHVPSNYTIHSICFNFRLLCYGSFGNNWNEAFQFSPKEYTEWWTNILYTNSNIFFTRLPLNCIIFRKYRKGRSALLPFQQWSLQ